MGKALLQIDSRSPWIPPRFSSCGSKCTGLVDAHPDPPLTDDIQEFIEAIDAIDNGISQYPTDIKPFYRSRTDLSSRVRHLNPAWNQPVDAEAVDVSIILLGLTDW